MTAAPIPEIVKARRVVDEDFAKQRRIAHPDAQALERRGVVDRVERLHLARVARAAREGMRPVAAPHAALGVRGGERAHHRPRIDRQAVRARQLHVSISFPQKRSQGAHIFHRFRQAEMVDHERNRQRLEPAQGVECAGIIGAVDARLHDHHPFQAQAFLQGEKPFHRRFRGV
jgi:hypothetical protein